MNNKIGKRDQNLKENIIQYDSLPKAVKFIQRCKWKNEKRKIHIHIIYLQYYYYIIIIISIRIVRNIII